VSSSNYPHFDVNRNTGRELGTERIEDAVTARQCVFHDSERASSVLLPVIPRS
jgi:predicted acyl esterase